jgi:hypothetical protein
MRPSTLDELGFERRPMVRWLSPKILLDAALRVVLSEAFGEYADKRELQAALDPRPGPTISYEDEDALWFDFVADLGDGFDSTYAVASLLGRERLELAPGDELPRAQLLVMGGDQVYPDPTREAYEHRFRGPYSAALPWVDGRQPDLLAIPGNHDWYDGLTNYLRIFCAGRRHGAWQTHQRRSYFAARLPHRWWLLGIDIQLDTYIDTPQMEWFKALPIEPEDRVVLVTGKPCWTKLHPGVDPGPSWKNIQYFDEQVVQARGAQVRAFVSGDLHHYARYEGAGGVQLLTSGGGGAYLSPTDGLKEEIVLPGPSPARLAARWPDAQTSRRLSLGAWKLPVNSPGLAGLLGVVHGMVAASAAAGWWGVFGVLVALLVLGFYGYCGSQQKARKVLLGGGHGVAHAALATLPAVVLPGVWLPAVAGVASGFVLGGLLFGLYLVVTHPLVASSANESLASQAIPDWKGFLRIRVDASGLTIHPVGIQRVPRAWAADPDAAPDQPFLRPVDVPLRAQRIEGPVHIPDDRAPAPRPVPVTTAGGTL